MYIGDLIGKEASPWIGLLLILEEGIGIIWLVGNRTVMIRV